MQRNPRYFTRLAATVLTIGTLLGLFLVARTYLWSPVQAPEANQPAFSSGPDLDADGRPDQIQAEANRLTVTAASGAPLLVYEGRILPGHQVARLGGEYPVLFVRTAEGEYAAFAYSPGAGLLQLAAWPGGQLRGYGELTPEGGLRHTVVGAATRQRVTRLRLNQLRLEAAGVVHEPLSSARPTPAEALAAAVEAVTLGIEREMGLHFPDPDVAKDFYSRWKGRLPAEGAVRVARADEVNAGAEHGHLVPVSVWVTGQDAVAGMQGNAEFVSGPTGVQILRIRLEPVPLKVASWMEAARLAGGGVKLVDAPFYGVFRFDGWAVDAVTGKVERE